MSIPTVNIGDRLRSLHEIHHRTMSSTTPGCSSSPILIKTTCTTSQSSTSATASHEDMSQIVASLKRDSSSGFNYQPSTIDPSAMPSKSPVCSNTVELMADEHGASSTLKLVRQENGVDTAVETSIELPVSWKPAIQQTTVQRDSWDHKIEFLLAVIGYAVDLGERRMSVVKHSPIDFFCS